MKVGAWIVCALSLLVGATLLVGVRSEKPRQVDIASDPAISASAIGEVRRQAVPVRQGEFGRRDAGPLAADVSPAESNYQHAVSEAEQSDEKMMDEVVDGLMKFLDVAFREKNYKRVTELLAKLKALGYGRFSGAAAGSGRSLAAKRRILQLLSELGPAVTAQLVGQVADLTADADPSLALQARQLIFDTLKEPTLSDYVRADIVTAAMAELHDVDAITQLYQEFICMRHSVGVKAFSEIDASGTAEAKAQMARAMGGFTSDAGITTIQQLNEWFPDNPDKPDDGVFYGHEDLADDATRANSR